MEAIAEKEFVLDLKQNKNGFTLIELIVVVAILGVLAAVLVPVYTGYIEKSRVASDRYALGGLNESTQLYYADEPSPNPFEVVGTTDAVLLQTLVGKGFYSAIPIPKQKNTSFTWDYSSKVWLLSGTSGDLTHVLTATEITMGNGVWTGYITGSYTGSSTEISIPKTLNGTAVLVIYQDVFTGKGITAVTFPSDGSFSRIHARAFKDNKLTEIVLPSSLTRIDYGAFLNNNITKVTIGVGVYLEGSVFQNSNTFNTAYAAQGAGTYIYTSGAWVKQ